MERRKAGAFVSLHIEGELRGCMGTILPTAHMWARRSYATPSTASSEDPRFPGGGRGRAAGPGSEGGRAEPLRAVSRQPRWTRRRYGVIVERGGRRGLLLPKLEGVDT